MVQPSVVYGKKLSNNLLMLWSTHHRLLRIKSQVASWEVFNQQMSKIQKHLKLSFPWLFPVTKALMIIVMIILSRSLPTFLPDWLTNISTTIWLFLHLQDVLTTSDRSYDHRLFLRLQTVPRSTNRPGGQPTVSAAGADYRLFYQR